MRAFGTYKGLYIAGITVQCVVLVAVMVRFLAPTNNVAKWLLDAIYNDALVLGDSGIFGFITDRAVVLSGAAVFSFIIDWAEALSITAVYVIFLPVIMTLIKNRRKQALIRVHVWASDAIQKLTRPSHEESATKQVEDWGRRLHSIIEDGDGVLANIGSVGNGVTPKVKKAVEDLVKLEECLNNHAEPMELKNLLQTTVIDFKEISNSTYQSVFRSP